MIFTSKLIIYQNSPVKPVLRNRSLPAMKLSFFPVRALHLPFIMMIAAAMLFSSCIRHSHDVIINRAMIYDGTGGEPFEGGIAVSDGRITHVGELPDDISARIQIDADGLAASPGFINMLSWADRPLLRDGRSMSNIKQGVTLEVMGEGTSMGPINEQMGSSRERRTGQRYPWTTLGGFLDHLEKQGVSTNIASFVGATTVRIYVLGRDNIAPDPEQLQQMKDLVREAMEQGAMGISTALIYTPAFYADTEELIALSSVASEYGGLYATHLRSEGNRFLEAIEEMLEIADKADIAVHIHHLKAAGADNWHKMDEAIDRVERAQRDGYRVSANMYLYTAASTGLTAVVPPWAREGGREAMIERFRDPELREKIIAEMEMRDAGWENFMQMVSTYDDIILTGFRSDELRPYAGKTLGDMIRMREMGPAETVITLIEEDNSAISAVYHLMTEDNLEKQIQLPWMTFGSDGGSVAAEGDYLRNMPHPRAYGNFARLLGRYVRDMELIPLEEAIHRLTGLSASVLGIDHERGYLSEGYHADIVLFNLDEIHDYSAYGDPHHYSTGVHHVFVNGVQVLKEGRHTGAKPGRVVRGPGWKGHQPAL